MSVAKREHPSRMLKKTVQQGHSERRSESYFVSYVEPLSEERTMLADFLSILLDVAAGSTDRMRALTGFFTIWH
jgi:hypothetical protein